MLREELTEALSHVLDLERLITRIVYGSANGKDLRAVCNTATVLPEVRELLAASTSEELSRIYRELDPLTDVCKLINDSVKEDAPFSIREGDIIADGYNKDVDYLRSVMKDGKGWLEKLAEEEEEFNANIFTWYYYYGIATFDQYVSYYGGEDYFKLQYHYEALLEKLPSCVKYEAKPTDAE